MIKLYVKNQKVTLSEKESIKLISRVKDVKKVGKIFDDFTHEFKVPADQNNNGIFQHISDGSVVGGGEDYTDFRIRQRARIEVGSITYKQGYVKYVKAEKVGNVIVKHVLKYTGGIASLSALLGSIRLNELQYPDLDHNYTDANVAKGLDNNQSLLEDKVIYPLMTNNPQRWTVESLASGNLNYTNFNPAVLVTEVLKVISQRAGIELEYIGTSGVLDNLYVWASKRLELGESITNSGYVDLVFSGYSGQVSSAYYYSSKIFIGNLPTHDFLKFSFTVENTSNSDPYKIEILQSTAVNNIGPSTPPKILELSGNHSGQVLQFASGETWGHYISISVISETEITMDVSLEVTIVNGATETPYFSGFPTTITSTNFANVVERKMPNVKAIDFFSGIIKLFNLIPTSTVVAGVPTIRLYTYESWRSSLGGVVDITDYVKVDNLTIDVPDIPKEIRFKYDDPESTVNLGFNEAFGRFYGNLEQSDSYGEGQEFKVEIPFENMLWEKQDNSEVLIGHSVDQSTDENNLGPVTDKIMLMYRNLNGAPGNINLNNNQQNIQEYKLCNSYNTNDTETLNFGFEIDPMNNNTSSVSLYLNHHADFIEHLLNPTTRYHKLSAVIPPAVITRINLASTLKIGQEYYDINSIATNSLSRITDFELITRFDIVPRPTPQPDTENPVIGVLSVETNPLPTTPTNLVPSDVSGTSFTLSWDESISVATSIVNYEVFKNGVSYGNTPINLISITGQELGSYNLWSVQAEDEEGQLSAISVEIGVQMFNSEGVIGEDAYTIILGNESHTLPTTNTGLTDYTNSGTVIFVLRGSTFLQGIVNGTPGEGQFKVSASGDNISVGVLTVGSPFRIGDHNTMVASNAVVNITIELEGLVTVTKVQSLAKATDGDDGLDGAGVTIVGSVADSGDLDPNYGGNIGDMYIDQGTGHGWVWNGTSWDDVGQIQGPQGPTGAQGIPGLDGADGESNYFHVAYADTDTGGGFSQNPAGKPFIGTYVDGNPVDSSDPNDYDWIQYLGEDGQDGSNGVAGVDGEDGQTSYLHIAYSDSADGVVNFSVTDPTGRTYMGTYVDFTLADSTNPSDYTWQLTQGVQGDNGLDGLDGVDGAPGSNGINGQTSYFHVAYADDVNGNGFSQDPTGKLFIGTYVDFTISDSNTPSDYAWALIRGEDGEPGVDGVNGEQGVPGINGENGQTSYLHIAYSNAVDGSVDFHLSDPNGRSYLGQYVDFNVNDSTFPFLYTWSLIQGPQGIPGSDGVDGLDGEQGVAGPSGSNGIDGVDGFTTYFHVAYADTSDGTGFSQNPNGKTYIGTYVDFLPQDSSTPSDYSWSLFVGADGVDGENGIPGENGADGTTYYLHIAYANNSTGTVGFSTTQSEDKLYIGQVVDTDLADPTNPSLYSWTKIRGEDGDTGPQGPQGLQGENGIDGIDGSNGSDGLDGSNGEDALSTALVFVYNRSVSQPANPTGGSFNFSTVTLTAPTGWSVGVPNGDEPVWISRAIASVVGQTGLDDSMTWNTPELAFQNGEDGSNGLDGDPGYSYFQGTVFRRLASQPLAPSGGQFNFGSNVLTPPTNWFTTPPTGSARLWSSNATFSVQGDTGIDNSAAWNTPGLVSENGLDGSNGLDGLDGLSVYQYLVYKRATSTPSQPTGGSYNFGTNSGTPPTGWSNTIPSGTDPIYVSNTVATVQGSTGIDNSLSWSSASLLAANGADGNDGSNGLDGSNGQDGNDGQDGLDATSTVIISVYRRALSTPSTPTGGSFNFTTNEIIAPTSWSEGIPFGNDPVYVSRALASILGSTGIDDSLSWTTPELAFQDGQDGNDGLDGTNGTNGVNGVDGYSFFEGLIYKRQEGQPTQPTGGQFDFGSNVLTPPSGWAIAPPNGDSPLWSTNGTFSTQGSTGVDNTVVWNLPGLVAQNGLDGLDGSDGANGQDGSDGVSGNSVFHYSVFRRSNTVPAKPIGGSYNFGDNVGVPPSNPDQWANSPTLGFTPLYVSTSLASVSGATGTDNTLVWTDPVLFVQNGEDGNNGNDGSDGEDGLDATRSATGLVYYQISTQTSPSNPSATAFNFNTGALLGLSSNWSTEPPIAQPGQQFWSCYFTVIESSPLSGTGSPTFNSPTQYLAFEDVVGFDDLGSEGDITINGLNIKSGSIVSNNFTISGVDYSSAGIRINISDGSLQSKEFSVDSQGKGYFKGLTFIGSTALTSSNTFNENTTKDQVGLSNVDNLSADDIRQGTTKAQVGLSQVDNLSASDIRSGTTKADVGLNEVLDLPPDKQVIEGLEVGVEISQGGITLAGGGYIRGGKTSYTSTTPGYFIGHESGGYRFYLGSATNYINWTGSNISVKGDLKDCFMDGGSIAISSSSDLNFNVATNGEVWFGGSSFSSAPLAIGSEGVLSSKSEVNILDGALLNLARKITDKDRPSDDTPGGIINFSPVGEIDYVDSIYFDEYRSVGFNANKLVFKSSGYFSFFANKDQNQRLDFGEVANSLTCTGDIISNYSDDRLKTKLGNIENALDKVNSLDGFLFMENQLAKDFGFKKEGVQVGVSAQQVREVLPQAVQKAPFNNDYLTVQYEKIVPLLIESIKELTEKIRILEEKN